MTDTRPLDTGIPGFIGPADPGRPLSWAEVWAQLGRAVIWLKHPDARPLPPDLQDFLVEGFRRQVEKLERRGARGRFIECVERGEPIPPKVRAALVNLLRKQMDKESGASGWLGGKAGRPPKGGDADARWIGMHAWYCYHLSPSFERLPKSMIEGGRYDVISEDLHTELVKFRIPLPGLSASAVARYVAEFDRQGFRPIPEGTHPAMARDIDERNITMAEIFCTTWLGLSDGDEAPAPPPAPVAKRVDILATWRQQARQPRPAPLPSPAEQEALRIVDFWYSQHPLLTQPGDMPWRPHRR